MRILHLATFLQGGAGRVITDLALNQFLSGHDVTVLTSRTSFPGHAHYGAYIDELTQAGVPLRLLDSLFSRDYAANLAVVQGLDALYPAGQEPDLIHAHATIPALIALVYAGARGRAIPVVQTLHGRGLGATPGQAGADIALMNLTQGIVVPSRHAANLLTSIGVRDDRLRIIPYGVSDRARVMDPFDEIAGREMLETRRLGALVAVSVGTIGARKNQALIVEALARAGGRADIHVWMIGPGDIAGLEAAASAAGVRDRIHLLGYSRAARSLAAEADVHVLASRVETQPLAIIEAFADGPLAVVSDIPELSELVGDGSLGFTFRSNDAGSLADVLMRVAQLSPAERLVWRTRARAAQGERHTTTGMTRQYLSFYNRLVSACSLSLTGVSSAA